MNKIQQLIQQYCPDGVEFKELWEVCVSISAGGDLPENYVKGQKLPTEEFPYPIYSNGTENNALYGYTDGFRIDIDAVTISARGTIGYHTIRKAKFTPIVRLIILIPNNSVISTKFLNYALDITPIGSSGGSIPQLTVPNVKKIQIPIPPLPIQQEIVSILDKFTTLEAELEAELEARRTQYKYYRDQLLCFEGKEVEWKMLGEVCFYPKNRISANFVDKLNYVGVDNLLQNGQGKTISSYVPSTGNLIEFKKNDVLIGNIRPYLKKIWLSDTIGGTNGDVIVVRINESYLSKFSTRFLYFILSSDSFFEYDMQFAKGAKMPRGDKDAVLKYKIPIPPIEEQERIVGILDKFDALVNDISVGLPAEIAARRKQYEYYRSKLLSFKVVSDQRLVK